MIVNIQALRGFAALLVVILHARLMTPIGGVIPFHFGNSGVDVFFVISGFIIGHVTASASDLSTRTFLLKRAIRVAPLYWGLTIAVFLSVQLAPSLAGAGGIPNFADLLRSLSFVPYRDGAGEIHPVLFMGWTLNYEAFFYLVFALTLRLTEPVQRLATLTLFLLAMVAIGSVVHPTAAIPVTYTDPLLLEFAGGMWLSIWFRNLPQHALTYRHATGWCALLAVSVASLIILDLIAPAMPRILLWGLPALLIVASALRLDRGGLRVTNRLFHLLGDASYSLYLTHVLVIKAASMLYPKLGITAMPLHAVSLLALYAACIAVAILVHKLVERPLLNGLRQITSPMWADPRSAARSETALDSKAC